MRMPVWRVGGLGAVFVLGFVTGCDPGTDEAQAAVSAAVALHEEEPAPRDRHQRQEHSDDPLIQEVQWRTNDIALALELTDEEEAVLLNILLHEADRLESARRPEADPRMKEAIEDHHQAVAEWKARELRRHLGATVAARIADYDLRATGRVRITPAHATARR